jgi:hypothetical protein
MANFDLPFGVRVAGDDPIDKDRYIAGTIVQRDAILDNARAHEGLQCYVEADKTLYILKGNTNLDWDIIASSDGAGGVQDVTYTELETLFNTDSLIPGQSYRITNFLTSWTVQSEGDVWSGQDEMVAKYVWPTQIEPLIVVADSPTTLQENASSELYPTHVIKYSADWNNAIDNARLKSIPVELLGEKTLYN